MAGERYVLLGLAQARSSWFRAVAQWTNSASIPAEFVKCVSAEELRARLATGRTFSAVLVDSALPSLDRDLVDVARQSGCAVIVVDDRRARRDWAGLGVQDVLPDFFDRKTLLESLGANARMVGRGETLPGVTARTDAPVVTGSVVAVCGPGGTGTSAVAIALAQGLADDPRHGGAVLLADLALHAEQAMLHDARDVVPGVQELVEAHRSGHPSPADVRALTFMVEDRNYSLLLGLRRSRAWSAIRPRAFQAAFSSLCATYRMVVCDIDADLEGEAEGGSVEVEERHVMARTAVGAADAVFVVGQPGMKGLHALVRTTNELLAFGVVPERLVPVINRSPTRPRQRGEIAAALATLTAGSGGAASRLCGPIFLPERRIDDALRDGVRLPRDIVAPLTGAWLAVNARPAPPSTGTVTMSGVEVPQRVAAGSLGVWSDLDPDTEPDADS